MKYLALIGILLPIVTTYSYAQKEQNVWFLGPGLMLDFNGSSPVLSHDGQIGAAEATTSVCDQNGRLLFYSNGQTVLNKDHEIVKNGTGLYSSPSTTQGVIAVAIPNAWGKYYLFTQFDKFSPNGQLYYSILDIYAEEGRGEILPGYKNILLDTKNTEKMTVVPADCHSWLITHKRGNNIFKAYKIDFQGIHPPVTTAIGSDHHIHNGYAGKMKVSPDGSKLAVASCEGFIEVFDFDIQTGKLSVSTPIHIEKKLELLPFYPYGLCFSPDGHKLYASWGRRNKFVGIVQYDLSQAPINNAYPEERIADLENHERIAIDLKLGPDNKIYITVPAVEHLGIIHRPNEKGGNCRFEEKGIYHGISSLFVGLPTIYALPNNIPKSQVEDRHICKGDTLAIELDGNAQYLWSNGAVGSTFQTVNSGNYWVQSYNACGNSIDSFAVHFVDQDSTNFLGDDRNLCFGTEVELVVPFSGEYLWSNGSTENSITASNEGEYIVQVKLSQNCLLNDTLLLTKLLPPEVTLSADTTVCEEEKLYLAGPRGDFLYSWNTGATSPGIIVAEPGYYTLQVENECGTAEDNIVVQERECPCQLFVPTAFSPNRDGSNEEFKAVANCNVLEYSLQIVDRWGKIIFSSPSVFSGWDGNIAGKPAPTGAYGWQIFFKGESINGKIKAQTLRGTLTLLR